MLEWSLRKENRQKNTFYFVFFLSFVQEFAECLKSHLKL